MNETKIKAKNRKRAPAVAVQRVVRALLDKPVWLPDGAGGWEKAYVNNIVFRTYDVADKGKHPSACVLTDTFLEDVKFEAP